MARGGRNRHPQAGQLPLLPAPPTQREARETATPYTIAVYRLALVRESSIPAPTQRLRHSKDAAALVRRHLAQVDREHFVALLLNRKNAVIGINTVSVGSLTASVVSPRELFKAAILANAASIICAHNHPSGDAQPSSEDKALTIRLVQAGKILGIEVLDHVIVGDGTSDYFSFADSGLLTGDTT